MVRFGTDRAKVLLQKVGFTDDQSISLKMLANSIETAQKRVEGNNFDIRKHLLEYDNVVNEQREIIYEKRNEILDSESIHEVVIKLFNDFITHLVESHLDNNHLNGQDLNEILEFVNGKLLSKKISLDDLNNMDYHKIIDYICAQIVLEYEAKVESVPKEIMDEFEKAIYLRVIDMHWMENINAMSLLREGIHLRSYAQENPLRAYTTEGFEMFDAMLDTIEKETTMYLLRAEIRQNSVRKQVAKGEAVSDNKPKKKEPKKVSKIGRNEPCPCGSGKKYKNCCGK